MITFFAALFFLSLPLAASAHGIGQVYALPVPLNYYLWGGGLAVAASFFVMSAFANRAPVTKPDAAMQASWVKPVLVFVRTVFALLMLLAIVSGLFGGQDETKSFAPVFFWVYFLIGMGLFSALVGNVWDKINPWKLLTDFLNLPKLSQASASGWISVILLLALFWFELVSDYSFAPNAIGAVLVAYTLLNIIATQIFSNWYERGEVFSVLFAFIGRLAHFKIGNDNRSVVAVRANNKLTGQPWPWWTLGIASVLLAGASFDSIKETLLWFDMLRALELSSLSLWPPTIGLILSPLPFLVLYFGAMGLINVLTSPRIPISVLARGFVFSLVPIAFGYTLAHNFSLLIVTFPQLVGSLSDPLVLGWNLFGTADYTQTSVILGAKAVWLIEVGFVVLAHIIGVWYAHVLALNIYKNAQKALVSQAPMALLMIAFTMSTLWLLSQPLVVGA